MTIKKIITIIIVLILTKINGFSQVDKGLNDTLKIRKECERIVTLFMNDSIIESFKKLKDLSILPLDEIDYLEQKTIEQLNLVEDRFGKSIGNKLVKTQFIDSVLYSLIYVVKYEKHGLRLRFIFYNGKNDKWYLNNFKWDDSLSSLLNEKE